MAIELYPRTADRAAYYGQPIRLERAPHAESAVLVWPADDPDGDFAFVHVDAREPLPDTWVAEHFHCEFTGADVCRTYIAPEGAFAADRRRYLHNAADIMVNNRMAHSQRQRKLEQLRRERGSPLATRAPVDDLMRRLLRG